jgi:hypothetical protein
VTRKRSAGVALVITLCALAVQAGSAAMAAQPPLSHRLLPSPAPLLSPYATLTGAATGESRVKFGWKLALAADGDTALVAEGDSAWVFVRAGGSWSTQAQLSLGGGLRGEISGVALSADGDTAVLAGPSAPTPVAAWAFSRSDGAWSAQGTPLVPVDAEPLPPESRGESEDFASSVAISGSGDTVVVGANQDDKETGAAFVFERIDGAWSQHAPKLTAASGEPSSDATSGEASFGTGIALSEDGGTVFVGDPNNGRTSAETEPPGAVYVYGDSEGAWLQRAKLANTEPDRAGWYGSSLAVDASGGDVLVGGDEHSLIFFSQASAGWREEAPPLIPFVAETYMEGRPSPFMALSADASSAIVSGRTEDNCGEYAFTLCPSGTRKLWAFDRVGATWVRQPLPLVRPDPFGPAVALAGNGETALISTGTLTAPAAGEALVAQITPAPQTGFVREATTELRGGQIEQRLWSAVAAHFRAVARVKRPLPRRHSGPLLYGSASASAPVGEAVSLTIRPTRAARRYLARHRRLTLTLTIQEQPQAPAPASTQTLTVTVTSPPANPAR